MTADDQRADDDAPTDIYEELADLSWMQVAAMVGRLRADVAAEREQARYAERERYAARAELAETRAERDTAIADRLHTEERHDDLAVDRAALRDAGDALAHELEGASWHSGVDALEAWRAVCGTVPAPDRAGDDEPRPGSLVDRDGCCVQCGHLAASHGTETGECGACGRWRGPGHRACYAPGIRAGGGHTAAPDPVAGYILARVDDGTVTLWDDDVRETGHSAAVAHVEQVDQPGPWRCYELRDVCEPISPDQDPLTWPGVGSAPGTSDRIEAEVKRLWPRHRELLPGPHRGDAALIEFAVHVTISMLQRDPSVAPADGAAASFGGADVVSVPPKPPQSAGLADDTAAPDLAAKLSEIADHVQESAIDHYREYEQIDADDLAETIRQLRRLAAGGSSPASTDGAGEVGRG